MKHEGITKDIIGAAMAVLNELKPGLDEKLYENALVIELVARGHAVEQQREFPVHYRPTSSWTARSSLFRPVRQMPAVDARRGIMDDPQRGHGYRATKQNIWPPFGRF